MARACKLRPVGGGAKPRVLTWSKPISQPEIALGLPESRRTCEHEAGQAGEPAQEQLCGTAAPPPLPAFSRPGRLSRGTETRTYSAQPDQGGASPHYAAIQLLFCCPVFPPGPFPQLHSWCQCSPRLRTAHLPPRLWCHTAAVRGMLQM